MAKAWKQSRYDKGDGDDYINCPMDEAQYNAFIDALLSGEKVAFKDWEKIRLILKAVCRLKSWRNAAAKRWRSDR